MFLGQWRWGESVSGNGLLKTFALLMYVDRDTNSLARMLAIFYGMVGKVSSDSSLMIFNITCLYPIGCRLTNWYQIHIINYLHTEANTWCDNRFLYSLLRTNTLYLINHLTPVYFHQILDLSSSSFTSSAK